MIPDNQEQQDLINEILLKTIEQLKKDELFSVWTDSQLQELLDSLSNPGQLIRILGEYEDT